MLVLILDDSPDRVRGFRAALTGIEPAARLVAWRSAHEMIAQVGEHLSAAAFVSLDHDLYAPIGSDDPGDGLDVAKFLVSQPVMRPVIVHSSNSDRATRMMGEFELANWPAWRALPFGDSWIEDDWLAVVREVLSR